MVYYILEDAVTPGSLAAKYLRQAAKWNGNEAYSKLYNGYVFSGPQTMSLLLAELVNIRFKADELRVLPDFACACGKYSRTLRWYQVRHPFI